VASGLVAAILSRVEGEMNLEDEWERERREKVHNWK
jgi:hypothetical protein